MFLQQKFGCPGNNSRWTGDGRENWNPFLLKLMRETGFAGEQAWQHGACSPCMTTTPHQFVLFLTGYLKALNQ